MPPPVKNNLLQPAVLHGSVLKLLEFKNRNQKHTRGTDPPKSTSIGSKVMGLIVSEAVLSEQVFSQQDTQSDQLV